MDLNGKPVDLLQLAAELTVAGVPHRGLGIAGDDLHTYDEDGVAVDVPASAGAVVATHVPPPVPDAPDYGSDATTIDQLAAGVTQLRAYLALPSPTAAQSAAALKLTIRAVLFLMRRVI